jgi:25S rRNA (uracil2843-N3)-methyltransferase
MGPRRKTKPSQRTPDEAADQQRQPVLPPELQQLILDQFTLAFPFEDAIALKTVIQGVKGHLYNRDFANAFGTAQNLEAYAVRWSASRALGYADLLLPLPIRGEDRSESLVEETPTTQRILCLGGGAGAELAALAAVIARTSAVHVTAVDIADWSPILTKLQTTLTTPAPLSAYASAAARQANHAFIPPENLELQFELRDILQQPWEVALRDTVVQANLVTIMFTLNELFTASVAKTTKMLLELTECMRPGARLLVVDSPGSYSEIVLGKGAKEGGEPQTKRYPMHWLLDHTLQDVAMGSWEKIMEDESRWFRISPGLKYNIDLENMRYQVHLYVRKD